MVKKIASLIQRLFRPLGSHASLFSYLSRQAASQHSVEPDSPIIAVEGVYDPLYFGLIGMMVIDLKKRIDCRAELIWIHSVSNAIGVGYRQSFFRSQLVSHLVFRAWYKAYALFVDRVGYCANSLLNPIRELVIFYRARQIHREIKNKSDFSNYEVDGVMIGDLIIDTYLRFRPSPLFDVDDSFVSRLLRQALRDLYKAERYFGTRKPRVYLVSYATYIQHGIPVRVALKRGTEVRCFPSALNFGKKLTKSDFYHSSNCDEYRSNFARLEDKDQKRRDAQAVLTKRFSGNLDIATKYMRVSAYANSNAAIPDVKNCLVIFLHDFYDSPHVYKDFIFSDFWAWATITIEILMSAKVKFAIKPHPNQISDSDRAVALLMERYPYLKILSTEISNESLAKSGITCGVTAYGTVAHELAYFGIPTIACARHPHHQYDFCRTARCLTEYRQFLQSSTSCLVPVTEMNRQALEFVYMHNLNLSKDDYYFRERVASYFSSFVGEPSAETIETILDELRQLPPWGSLINQLKNRVLGRDFA